MGKQGKGALPTSLKVKNTFIDVKSSFVQNDEAADASPQNLERRRQVSAPCPTMQRSATYMSDDGEPLREVSEEDFEEGLEAPEPETEIEPARRQQRQDSDLWTENLGRQVTEQAWPTWGHGVDAAQIPSGLAPLEALQAAVDSTAAQLWMYQQGMNSMGSSLEAAFMQSWPEAIPQYRTKASKGSSSQSARASDAIPVFPQKSATPTLPPGGGAAGTVPTPEWANVTTVMMRNLPNKYSQTMLLEDLNQAGFLCAFDFLYLPIDPETCANRGYAFINFTDPSYAWMLKVGYEGQKMPRFNSDKVVSVAPAALQGFEANYAHYSTARVSRGDPNARPLFLRESIGAKQGVGKQVARRRGGRRSQGSLVDLAAKSQQEKMQHEQPLTRPLDLHAVPFTPSVPPLQSAVSRTAETTEQATVAGSTYIGLGSGLNGRRKEHGQLQAPGISTGSSTVPKFCPFCGGACEPHFRFCQFCGASLNLTATGQSGKASG